MRIISSGFSYPMAVTARFQGSLTLDRYAQDGLVYQSARTWTTLRQRSDISRAASRSCIDTSIRPILGRGFVTVALIVVRAVHRLAQIPQYKTLEIAAFRYTIARSTWHNGRTNFDQTLCLETTGGSLHWGVASRCVVTLLYLCACCCH